MKLLRVTVAGVVAAAAALLALPATAAQAGLPTTGLQHFWNTSFGGSTFNNVFALDCPSGTTLVGGGFSHVYAAGGGPTPGRNFTNYQVSGPAMAPSPNNYGQVEVICAPASMVTNSYFTTQTFTPSRDVPLTGTIYCHSGDLAFGGGGWMQNTSGGLSSRAYGMVSNSVSANGQGWTYRAATSDPTDVMVVQTRCAPRQGDYVQQTGVPVTTSGRTVTAMCESGFTAISGGAYLARPGGSESLGRIGASWGDGFSSWTVTGYAASNAPAGTRLVALAQCIRSIS